MFSCMVFICSCISFWRSFVSVVVAILSICCCIFFMFSCICGISLPFSISMFIGGVVAGGATCAKVMGTNKAPAKVAEISVEVFMNGLSEVKKTFPASEECLINDYVM